MDRQTTYSGQVPRVVDLLQAQQNIMVALAKLSAGILGTNTIVNNFTCTPTTPATLDVVLTPGEIYQVEDLEQTQWSSLNANLSTSILKQGIGFVDDGEWLGWGVPATIAITPPTTFGYSQVYLIEVQYQDFDSGALVLPYYNAANPTAPFAGPGNAGSAQNTARYGAVAYQLKAGVAATTGSQTAPTVDPGWTALFTVTVAQGQTTITAGNIETLIGSVPALPTAQPPFIPVTLPQVPVATQSGMWQYGVDTSTTVNAIVADNFDPPISTLVPGMTLRVKIGSWATVNFTGTVANGSNQITDVSSTVGLVDGQLLSGANIPAGTTISTAGSPITMSGDATGAGANEAIIAYGNTGAVTLDVGTGANSVVRATGAALSTGDIAQANQILEVVWTGTAWQVVNFYGQGTSSGGGGGSNTNNYYTETGIPYCADTSPTANLIVAPFSPAVTPAAGEVVVVRLANSVTGPTTIEVNGNSAVSVLNSYLQPLANGDAVAGEMLLLTYTGSAWQLVSAGGLVQQFGGMVGTYTDLIGSAPGGSKTASWTIGGIVAATALNGRTYKGAGLSLSFNGGTAGANGMDTGSPPVSADLSVYAIYNPTTQTWATLGCAGSTSNGLAYTGSNLPSGYTASCLIFSGKTDGSANIIAFNQTNNAIDIVPSSIFQNNGGAGGSISGPGSSYLGYFTSYGGQSLAVAVPANAKFASVQMGMTGPGASWASFVAMGVASTASGIGAQTWLENYVEGGAELYGAVQFVDVQLVTAQTIYWAGGGDGAAVGMWVTRYRI